MIIQYCASDLACDVCDFCNEGKVGGGKITDQHELSSPANVKRRKVYSALDDTEFQYVFYFILNASFIRNEKNYCSQS